MIGKEEENTRIGQVAGQDHRLQRALLA